MFRKVNLAFRDKELRTKIFKIIGLLIVARLLTVIPLPGMDVEDLSGLIDNNAVFGLLDTISGGGYGSLSFVMLGISPFITASIIFQLLGVIIPKIKEIQKEEGQQGQQKINRWTRWATVPLAAFSGWGILRYLANPPADGTGEAVASYLPDYFVNATGGEAVLAWGGAILALTAGAIVVMWIGELITEFKMGNGISLLILAGIVASLPGDLSALWPGVSATAQGAWEVLRQNPGYVFNPTAYYNFFSDPQWFYLKGAFILLMSFVVTLVFVVFMNDAVRKLVVVYTRRGFDPKASRMLDQVKADLPMKVNMAGVMPIIFAISFILFPSILGVFFGNANVAVLSDGAQNLQTHLSPNQSFYEGTSTPVQEPQNIADDNFLSLYKVDTADKLLTAKAYDFSEGADYLGFTFNNLENGCTLPEGVTEADLTKGVNLNNKFFGVEAGCTDKVSFLPNVAWHWNGVSAYVFWYFLLVIFFTYFYTSTIAFKTEDVAENLQKSGAYIPGYRPGEQTRNFLDYVLNRLNLVGAIFLAIVATFPIMISRYVHFNEASSLTTIVGGTTILILVSVAIDALRQVDAQITAVDYDSIALEEEAKSAK